MTRADRFAVPLLCVAVLAAYANALPAAFQFDDYNVIVDNPAVHSLGAWLDSMPGIRPLLKLSYTLNWVAGGAIGFHAVNALIHTLNALLVHRLSRWAVGASPGSDPAHADSVALAAALVFALHPAQTEAVTYASGRSVSLMAAFYLGAALAWVHGRSMLSALLFAAALGAKETAWTLPFALMLLACLSPAPWRTSLRSLTAHWVVLALFAVAVLAIPGYRRLLYSSLGIRTLGENLLAQIEGVWYLLTQPLLLLRTNIDPDVTAPGTLSVLLLLKAAFLLGLIAAGFAALRRRPLAGVAVLWTLLHFVPTNSVLPRLDVANDRQLYLSLLGPALLLADAIWRWLPRRVALVVVTALAAALGTATIARNTDYRDEISLWQATVSASPRKARAWNNLGYAYRLAGDVDAARAAFLKALEVDPRFERARHNLNALERDSPQLHPRR